MLSMANLDGIDGPICTVCEYPSADDKYCTTCGRAFDAMNVRESTKDVAGHAARYAASGEVVDDSDDEDYSPEKGNDDGFGVQADMDSLVGNQSVKSPSVSSCASGKSVKSTKSTKSTTAAKGKGKGKAKERKPKGTGHRSGTVVVMARPELSKNPNAGEDYKPPKRITKNYARKVKGHPDNIAFMRQLEEENDLDDTVDHENIKARYSWRLAAQGYSLGSKTPNGALKKDGNVHKYPRYTQILLDSGHFNQESDFVKSNRHIALRVAREFASKKAPTQKKDGKTWDQLTEKQQEALIVKLSKNTMQGFDGLIDSLEWEAKEFGTGSGEEEEGSGEEGSGEEEEEEEEEYAEEEASSVDATEPRLEEVPTELDEEALNVEAVDASTPSASIAMADAPKRPSSFCNPVGKKPRLQLAPQADTMDDEEEHEYAEEEDDE